MIIQSPSRKNHPQVAKKAPLQFESSERAALFRRMAIRLSRTGGRWPTAPDGRQPLPRRGPGTCCRRGGRCRGERLIEMCRARTGPRPGNVGVAPAAYGRLKGEDTPCLQQKRPQAGARGARGGRLAADPVVAARVRVVRQDPREEQAARDPARGRPRARARGRPVEPLAGVDAGRVRRGRRVLRRRLAQVLETPPGARAPPRRGPGGSGRRCWPRHARGGGCRPARTSRSGYSPGR